MFERKQIYWFYKRDKSNLIEIDDKFKHFFFKPTVFSLKLHKGSVLLYLFWYIFSFGRYRIFYIIDKKSDTIAHYSNILPKIFKYSFMEKQDIHIANCHTYPKFRGNRLFSFSLSFIGKSVSEHVVWVGTRNNNTPSIKSIEKAGYLKTANACKSKFLGIYKLKAIE